MAHRMSAKVWQRLCFAPLGLDTKNLAHILCDGFGLCRSYVELLVDLCGLFNVIRFISEVDVLPGYKAKGMISAVLKM